MFYNEAQNFVGYLKSVSVLQYFEGSKSLHLACYLHTFYIFQEVYKKAVTSDQLCLTHQRNSSKTPECKG